MTTLDDERMDQRLRRAGERLRHDAPSPAATADALEAVRTMPPPQRRTARWVAPAVLAAVAASVIALLVFAGTRDEAVEERPADLPVTPPTTAASPPTTAAAPPPTAAAHIYTLDFDGAGGQCYSLVGQDGVPAQACVAGDQNQLGRAVMAAVDGRPRAILWPEFTSEHGLEDSSCWDDLAAAYRGRFVDVVTCGDGQPVFGLLPVEPSEETEWFVRGIAGRDVAIDLLGGDGAAHVFDVPDAALRPCRIVATQRDDGEWVDACSPEATVRALAVLSGAVYLIGPSADALVSLSEEQSAALGCADLPALLDATRPAGGVTIRLTCRGELAVVVQGSAELVTGRTGTWAMALDHSTDEWLVVAQGESLPCEPTEFCAAFGPIEDVNDLAAAAAPIPRL